MFCQHSIIPKWCACPLLGWNTNCHKWLNVAWLVRQILTIHGSQIEIKQVFNVVGIFISVWRCWFEVKNLDSLFMIYKNWPKDAKVGCSLANENVIKFFTIQANFLESHEVIFSEARMFEEQYVACGFYVHILPLSDPILKLGISFLLNSRF